MTLTRCLATNCQTGLLATNAGATIYAEGCTLSRDTNALDAEDGTLITRGDNTFTNNASNGTFTSTLAAK